MSMHDERGTQQLEDVALEMLDEQAEARIRRVWHDGRWFFSVIDVVGMLTGTERPRKYWFDMKRYVRDEGFHEALSDCRQLKVPAANGKLYETDCADFATLMSLLFALPAWKRSRRRGAPPSANHDACTSGIYAITNILTQEQYLGSSGDIPTRFNTL